MKSFYQFFLLEQLVWVPIVICLIRYKRIHPRYLPLFTYLIARAILEIAGNLVVIFIKPMPEYGNAPFYNFTFLLEGLLITWQLYKLQALKKNRQWYICLQILWVLIWLIDNFYIGSFAKFNLMFHTSYSFLLLFVITTLISKIALSKRQSIYRNPDFWFCISFALWFIYSIFYAFSKYLVVREKQLYNISNDIIKFMEFAEVLLYLLLAWAMFLVPPKRKLYIA